MRDENAEQILKELEERIRVGGSIGARARESEG